MSRPRRKRNLEGLVETREVMDEGAVAQALRRLAGDILARNPEPGRIVLVGIRTCGAFLARRLRKLMRETAKTDVPVGAIDITLYRDDVFVGLPRPEVGSTELPGSIDGKTVILVDD